VPYALKNLLCCPPEKISLQYDSERSIALTQVNRGGHYMMNNMTNMMGGAGWWGMGLFSLLITVLLILAIAALVKYVFFK
jgi:uncharacterized membrane protein